MLCGQVTSRSEFGVWCKNQETRPGPTEISELEASGEGSHEQEREGRSLQVSGKGQKDKNKMGIEVKDRALGALEESTGIPKLL